MKKIASPLVSLKGSTLYLYNLYLSPKYSKIYRSKAYPNLVKGLIDIKLYKYLSFIYLG